jgi:hypothetical protein
MPYAWFFGRKDDDKYQGFEESVTLLREVMINQVRFSVDGGHIERTPNYC